jgi:transposase
LGAIGGPPKLNAEENKLLLDLARETPRSVTNMITELFEKTGKLINYSTVKRLLKNTGLKWKRIRKTTKNKPNADETK